MSSYLYETCEKDMDLAVKHQKEHRNKKQQILIQMKNKQQKAHSQCASKTTTPEQEIRDLKRKLDQSTAALRTAEKENSRLQNALNTQKDVHRKQVNELTQCKLEIKQLEIEKQTAIEQLEKLTVSTAPLERNKVYAELLEVREELRACRKELQQERIRKIGEFHKELERKDKMIKSLTKAVWEQRSLKSAQKSQNKRLIQEIQKLKIKPQYDMTHEEAHTLLAALETQMGIDNLFKFQALESLWAKYLKCQEYNQVLERERYQPQETIKTIYGFMIQQDGDWFVHSLNQHLYPVCPGEIHESDAEFVLDTPVKAVLRENGYVEIDKNYSIEDKSKTNHRPNIFTSNSPTFKRQQTDHLPQLEKIKVLIIGSRFKRKYMDHLRQYGLQVSWFDAYENSPALIEGKVSSADIVIACKAHMPHVVLDHLDENDPRVELMHFDNKTTLFARIRYTAIKLGLIALGEETESLEEGVE